jgi:hypothetical protein
LWEGHCLLDAGFRPITGFGNNIANPTWGELGTDLPRVSPGRAHFVFTCFSSVSAPVSLPGGLFFAVWAP